MSTSKCRNNPDKFCYICGEVVFKNEYQSITENVKSLYRSYFKIEMSGLDKSYVPSGVCRNCITNLRFWSKGVKKHMPFAVPMIWSKPSHRVNDCYFCACTIEGFNRANRKLIEYPANSSSRRPIPHEPSFSVPLASMKVQDKCDNDDSDSDKADSAYETIDEMEPDSTPKLFDQQSLNDLIRDLGLTKRESELLGSRLRERNLLARGTTFSQYRDREEEFTPYFSKQGSLIFCNDVPKLMDAMGLKNYKNEEWRLFVDSSTRSLKAVLLHNGNEFASIPVAHSGQMKETYENMEILLEALNYRQHNWEICGDFKILSIFLGQQGGNTKYPCFLCEWDSRADSLHWTDHKWAPRESLQVGKQNVIREQLVEPTKILLPPLHIKLGVMKQWVKGLDRNGKCFKYLAKKFPKISEGKLKEGIFVGPQIRKLTKDKDFEKTMTAKEKAAWIAFKKVIHGFLGNNKEVNYRFLVKDMLKKLGYLGCRQSTKLHYLDAHLDFFPEGSLGRVSEEQGERFHQDIKEMETRYQGHWDVSMLADYCWCLKRDDSRASHRRISLKRSFECMERDSGSED